MKARIICLAGLIVLAVSMLAVTRMPARAAGSWYVSNKGNDSNDCASPTTTCASINAALNKPGFVASDTVLVATGIYTGTGNEAVLINQSVTLSGGWDATFAAQSGMSTIDGQGARRGAYINSGTSVTIDRFVVQNGSSSSDGGGIYNNGTLTLSLGIITNNTGGAGGGIGNGGILAIVKSSVSNNVATAGGGGIRNWGTIKLSNSSVSGNVAPGMLMLGGGGGINNWGTLIMTDVTISDNNINSDDGGGIFNANSILILNNTTISRNKANRGGGIYSYSSVISRDSLLADNTATYMGPECYGSINSVGYNLVQDTSGCTVSASTGDQLNVNAQIYPLLFGSPAYNPLKPDSPAIDAGNPAGCKDQDGNMITTDQRGTLRPMDGNGDGIAICDIGAYEFDPNNPIRQVYLPLISKPIILGINGHVTLNGVAASGVPLDLRFYNGSAWSTFASTTTGANGSYSFLTAPSLGSGQKYYVRYLNSADTSRLSLWQTRVLTSYNAGTNVAIGDFDIANFIQTSPASGATVALPYLFQWNVRPSTPTDSYQFNLFNPFSSDGQPSWWTSPLGYVGSYSLNSLPTGFNPGTQYGWYVAIFSPDGGYGEPYYYRRVTFSNTGNGPQIKLPLVPKNLAEGSLSKPRSKPEGAR